MSDTGVCVLAFKCPGLLRYTAYRCKQLSDTSIIAVASHCPFLQKVHVGNQDKLTDEGLKQVNARPLPSALTRQLDSSGSNSLKSCCMTNGD